jgi:hypothetical protein
MTELKEGQILPEDWEDFDELQERANELKGAVELEICKWSVLLIL